VTLRDLLSRSVHEAAPALVGWTLLVDGVGGRVVAFAQEPLARPADAD